MPPRDQVASASCSSSSRGIQEEEPRGLHSWDQVHREKDVRGMVSPPKEEREKMYVSLRNINLSVSVEEKGTV